MLLLSRSRIALIAVLASQIQNKLRIIVIVNVNALGILNTKTGNLILKQIYRPIFRMEILKYYIEIK
jgi:hypothetical protein